MVILALMLSLAAEAGVVTRSEALQTAREFLAGRGVEVAAEARGSQKDDASAQYYVFNAEGDRGFVVVSGDDRTTAILGYADEGCIDEANMPDGLRALLEGYAEQMMLIDDGAPAASRRAAGMARKSVSPLIRTKWDQDSPYNLLCPVLSEKKTVTGCVATAMAQVMYYHQWPTAATAAIPGYRPRNGLHGDLPELAATTFGWNNMTLTYGASSTDAQNTAVATLMKYCGWALQMNYDLGSAKGSSAYNVSIAEALKTYFGYDGSVTYAQRQHYTYTEWIDMIYAELAERRPVVLGGQSVGGGHSFVCDGYQGDDYFHLNWGWGGSGNGYFRLSVLNPYEQGIGGSSTLDGFSFTQDAVIGIKPYDGQAPAAYLSLEKFQFDASGSSATQVVNRASADDAFTGISLYAALCNYSYVTSTYDYDIQLVRGDGSLVSSLGSGEDQSFTFNTDLNISSSTIATPAGLGEGTYYIKVVSRANGASTWQECYDGPQQQMTATVSGNTLTITAPKVRGCLPTSVTFTVTGSRTVGSELDVTARVTGGAADYHDNLILRVNGTAVMGKTVDIAAGQTVDVHFAYTPSTTGDNVLTLWNAKTGGSQVSGSETITIGGSDATDNLDLTLTAEISNLTGDGKVYGSRMVVPVTVTNNSATNSYAGRMYYSLYEWTQDSEDLSKWTGTLLKNVYRTITVDKNTTAEQTPFNITGLERGKRYSVLLYYQKNGVRLADPVVTLNAPGNGYEVTDGFLVADENGAISVHQAAGSIDAGTARYVSLQGLSDEKLALVTSALNTNPNCLWLLNEGTETPIGLTGKNVVKGNTASAITLTDGYDFYTPVSFTASDIRFNITFTRAATSTGGWNTIMLPFDVATVKVDDGSVSGKTVDWFRSSSDTGKNFWVKTFTGDDGSTVYFDFATSMTANTPYLIAVPGDTWGEEWRMTDKTVTFYGTDATVAATASTFSLSGDRYKFCGSTLGTERTDIYALNSTGKKFVKQTSSTTPGAFRAWISGANISSLTMSSLSISSGVPTMINTVTEMPRVEDDTLYDLLGRPVKEGHVKTGVYIKNGRKVIIK